MYNHAPAGYDCPFCEIASQLENHLTRREDLIYHDDRVTAFINLARWPNNPGSALVIPNVHYENIYDLPLKYATAIHDLARAIALAMKTTYPCDGISTRQHNEPAGSQDVWHYHLHVFPRYPDDQFYLTMPQPADPTDRAAYAHRLRDALRDWHPAPLSR